ncbi:hypothetical protein BGX27_001410 [Mortierella sp. AM989]|nr:hypothetical protein BGX27_001410 [Mortierella sp. AM989]
MYASPSCELIFGIDPDDLLGKPLLLYIRADDLASFVEQGDMVKSTAGVVHMRFWFQSPNCRQEIPIEATLIGTSDALVLILRKCLPFKRKQFITNYSTSDHYTASSSPTMGSFSSGFSRSSSASSWDETSSRSSNFGDNSSYGRYGSSYGTRSDSTGSPTMVASSSASSLSSSASSPSSFQSTSSRNSRVAHTYYAPLRNIPLGSINSIRELDREQHRLKPLTSLCEVTSESTDTNVTSAETYPTRKVHSADLDVEEESGIIEGTARINLHE